MPRFLPSRCKVALRAPTVSICLFPDHAHSIASAATPAVYAPPPAVHVAAHKPHAVLGVLGNPHANTSVATAAGAHSCQISPSLGTHVATGDIGTWPNEDRDRSSSDVDMLVQPRYLSSTKSTRFHTSFHARVLGGRLCRYWSSHEQTVPQGDSFFS